MEYEKIMLLQKEEVPRMDGTLNEAENFGLWAMLTLWLGDLLKSKTTGKAYTTITGAIRHGLPSFRVPFVGGWVYGLRNPADRATVTEGSHRLSVYHRDHTGQVVNPALEFAYKNRISTVALKTAVREICGCSVEGCLIHPVEKTGGGERVMGTGNRSGSCIGIPTGRYITVGDVAKDYANRVDAGLGDNKTPILGMSGGRVVVAAFKTLTKRSGNGNNPTQPVCYRYATVCHSTRTGVCGAKTCFGLCGEKDAGLEKGAHAMLFTIVNTMVGRTMVGLDPRGRTPVAVIRAALEEQVGGAIVVQPVPFDGGVQRRSEEAQEEPVGRWVDLSVGQWPDRPVYLDEQNQGGA